MVAAETLRVFLANALATDSTFHVMGPIGIPELMLGMCSVTGKLSPPEGGPLQVANWRSQLAASGVGRPWSTQSWDEQAEERTYLDFFARLCIIKLTMAGAGPQMIEILWRTLGKRVWSSKRWNLPSPTDMATGIEKYGVPDVSDLPRLIISTGETFATSAEVQSHTVGDAGDREVVKRKAMEAFVLSELLPYINGSYKD
jgi:hypothetical protein